MKMNINFYECNVFFKRIYDEIGREIAREPNFQLRDHEYVIKIQNKYVVT